MSLSHGLHVNCHFDRYSALNDSLVEAITNSTQINLTKEEVLEDLRVACESRHASLIGRKEVFQGKAKFGIFGDGKEVAQLAMAKVFENGDFRSGYYRDQTFMFATGQLTAQQYFAQLYAHAEVAADPATAGRCMNSHFANRWLDENGEWLSQTQMKNSSADVSPTAGQMIRLLGLAYASKLYRQNPALHDLTDFSVNGNEVAFGTIGNASCAEGLFFESINAAGVLQVPMLVSVWDDGYGISVPNEYQVAKSNISEALSGLQRTEDSPGYEIFVTKGWDYPHLVETYRKAAKVCREEHVPVLVHVIEVTQPQGHSTSGSHERYKTKDRLEWEKEFDPISKMKEWAIGEGLVTQDEYDALDKKALDVVKKQRASAWKSYRSEIKTDLDQAISLTEKAATASGQKEALTTMVTDLKKEINAERHYAIRMVKKAIRLMRFEAENLRLPLVSWLDKVVPENEERYSSHLYSQSAKSAMKVPTVAAVIDESDEPVDGWQVMQACFDSLLSRYPEIFAIGEDVGKIGDVNQGFKGMQEKYGEVRVTDTGIREATIMGQAIGAAMRGLRPIAEIQYLDYIHYAVQILSDDLASLQYRTRGGQKAPVIIRTRGHRLEGIWHSGSPIGFLLHSLRGIRILVPRDMTIAAGFYNTMIQSDEPALIIECLNGYRLKERIPRNLAEYTVPLGVPETIREGSDITIVTYGSMCRIVTTAAEQLQDVGISIEVIDVQTLLPFDIHGKIAESIQKTNRVIFADEDVPGGASAYMMQQVVDGQEAYRWLDSKPMCLSAKDHRPAYAGDGDYFSKPSVESVFDMAYEMMREAAPAQFPKLY